MAERDDEGAAADGLLQDIAALARQLAEQEPFRSGSGPDALRALAARLDGMVTPSSPTQPAIVQVAVRAARKKPAR